VFISAVSDELLIMDGSAPQSYVRM
jgi:hypothetical protein